MSSDGEGDGEKTGSEAGDWEADGASSMGDRDDNDDNDDDVSEDSEAEFNRIIAEKSASADALEGESSSKGRGKSKSGGDAGDISGTAGIAILQQDDGESSESTAAKSQPQQGQLGDPSVAIAATSQDALASETRVGVAGITAQDQRDSVSTLKDDGNDDYIRDVTEDEEDQRGRRADDSSQGEGDSQAEEYGEVRYRMRRRTFQNAQRSDTDGAGFDETTGRYAVSAQDSNQQKKRSIFGFGKGTASTAGAAGVGSMENYKKLKVPKVPKDSVKLRLKVQTPDERLQWAHLLQSVLVPDATHQFYSNTTSY